MTVYGHDPVAMALRWQEEGAEWLHVVDLDGALGESTRNRRVVEAIAAAVTIPVQVGGGIRDMTSVSQYLECGVGRVILGTVALRQQEVVEEACRCHPGRIALGIDARDGRVAIHGWRETTATAASELLGRYGHLPLACVIYTDIHRDGMGSGVNVEATGRLLEGSPFPVIASGGVAELDDLRSLEPLVAMGLEGVIIGRALYTGSLELRDAIAWSGNFPRKR
jgi:phosphoribosylformimino-5-aminoimidazole carboxamide ribotide isomerase